MKLLKTLVIAGTFVAGMVGTAFALPAQWSTSVGGNGHSYEVIPSNYTWDQAKTAAEIAGGYLATITSASEQLFIQSLVQPHLTGSGIAGFKLGGFQTGSDEPGGGWQWVTGENWNSYTNWGTGEPNNVGNVNEAFLYLDERFQWAWNDYISDDNYYSPKGYIVEYAPVPEPSTVLLLGAGLGSLAVWSRRRRS